MVDVHCPHLDYTDARVVVPPHARTDTQPVAVLHPAVVTCDAHDLLATRALGSVQRRRLGHPIGRAAYRNGVTGALDMLLVGF